MRLELPHTSGCLVCGPANAIGFRLKLYVDPASGAIETHYSPAAEHIGFQGIIHGGAIATILDEAMVWAASWQGKRFCVCGEMSVRFRQSARVDQALVCRAKVEISRARLITTTGEALDEAGKIVATATGKYVPLSEKENEAFLKTFIRDPETAEAARALGAGN